MAIGWLALGAFALLAVLTAASRVAALAVPRGLLRAIATAVLAAATLVLHALLLGLLAWGSSPVALAAAAFTTLLVVRALTPRPAVTITEDLLSWAGRLRTPVRALLGACAGAMVGWLVWLWRWPYVGYDGMVQNLLEVTIWIHGGQPGSQHRVFGMAPIEAFPMTNDVLVTWGTAFGRSFAVVAPLAIAIVVLLILGLASVLHSMEVPRSLSVAAIACVLTVPHVVALANTPKTDLPALAWLACCAALALGSRSHPRLLGIVLVAAGLSVGSKTTTAPLVVVVVAAALWGNRAQLRKVLPWIVAGAVMAVGVGGVWYLRNLVDHGSPLWPMGSTPWGDPLPPLFEQAGDTFVDAPRATLQGQARRWIGIAGAALVLPLAGVVAGLMTRRAAVRWLAFAGCFALGLWALAPVTGVSNEPLAADVVTSTTRYLLPAAALGAVTLAVWARRRRHQTAVLVLLWTLTAANLWAIAVHRGQGEMMPSAAYVVGGAATALVVALVGARWRALIKPPRGRAARRHSVLVPLAAVVLVAVGIALSSERWTARHREILLFGGAPIETLLADPRFLDGDAPVYVTNIAWSDLVGDHLAHEVRLLESGIPCEELDLARADGWLVLVNNDFFGFPDRPRQRGCLEGVTPLADDGQVTVFEPAESGIER